jgi:polysaccharide biosynthesis/export protein
MKHLKIAFILIPWLALLGCQSKGPRFDAQQRSVMLNGAPLPGGYPGELSFQPILATNNVTGDQLKPPADFFRLGPGDIIEIEVLGEKGSESVVSVGPDGKVYYSLLPATFVWGLTLTEAKNLIEDELAKYIRIKPEVSVILRGVSSRRFWILGNVEHPGIFTMATPLTLLEAITLAGGTLTDTASSEELVDFKNSFLLRDGQPVPVDFYRLLRQGDFSQNIYLKPGDYIYMRPALSRDIYVLGAVAAPNIVPYSKETTLMAAIASVGGTIPYAYLSHLGIVRGSLSDPSIATVNYVDIIKGKARDVRLEPGDIVYVPLRPFYKVEIFGKNIIREFVRTLALNEGNRAVLKNPSPVGVSIGSGTLSAP